MKLKTGCSGNAESELKNFLEGGVGIAELRHLVEERVEGVERSLRAVHYDHRHLGVDGVGEARHDVGERDREEAEIFDALLCSEPMRGRRVRTSSKNSKHGADRGGAVVARESAEHRVEGQRLAGLVEEGLDGSSGAFLPKINIYFLIEL